MATEHQIKDVMLGKFEFGAQGVDDFGNPDSSGFGELSELDLINHNPLMKPFVSYIHPHAQFAYNDDQESERQPIYVFGGFFPKETFAIKKGHHHNREVHLRPNETMTNQDEFQYLKTYKCVFHSPLLH